MILLFSYINNINIKNTNMLDYNERIINAMEKQTEVMERIVDALNVIADSIERLKEKDAINKGKNILNG